ncbi:MAG: UvrB/UvrC motif-containing protein, partial [Dehalococcoidia bacterium]|nr:UvrB/UvrC motif-containing protein [Dehalococcoidia bacterium]
IMYADVMTDSMRKAIDETNRRRAAQESYNRERGVTPEGIHKAIRDITDHVKKVAEERAEYLVARDVPKDELARLVKDLESQMKAASKNLEFEKAALLRDQVYELRKQLVSEADALHQFAETAYGSLGGRRPRPGGARETSARTRRGRRPRVRYGK